MAVTKPYIIFAKYNAEANERIIGIMKKLTNDEREKDRGSFYGSLSGLVRHILGGTYFFAGMFTKTLAGNAAALDALAVITAVPRAPEGALSETGWKELTASLDTVDRGYIALIEALRDGDLDTPIEVSWYGGKPATVPLDFMLQQLVSHNIHHRGQISQILDELNIDNDYSMINAAFLPNG
jgi:uncharacterized damage-inducible protein DinB